MRIKILPCVIGVIICLAIGMLAGWVTEADIIMWYPTLKQPGFTPPAYVFGPVWTVLYIMMGIAVGLIYQTKDILRIKALGFFVLQLIFNGLWSFIFFRGHALVWAAVDLALLWLALVMTIYLFYKIKPLAAYLLLPYLLWASFAFLINVSVAYLN